MTDQNIPAGLTPREAKKAREWALHALNKPGASNTAEKAVARVVIGTVPEPRPTLADMTPEKREECRWMQADVEGYGGRFVIVNPYWKDGIARVLWPGGFIEETDWEQTTPRPDLPLMEWPGTEKADDEKTVKIGDVIESADDPRIAALPDGSVLLDREGEATAKRNHSWRGAGYTPVPSQGVEFGPWAVVRIGQENE